MTEPRNKKDILSETCKTHLVDVYVRNKYNRFTEIHGKQLEKGNSTENDSITTVSRITKQFLKKNEICLSNDFISGTPDMFVGEDITKATAIRDAKSSWDIFTFNRSKNKELDPKYYWQLHGYGWLTGATDLFVDFCLNNTPYHILNGELHKESYKHKDGNTPNWIELQIIANHVYDKKSFDEYIDARGCFPKDENDYAIYNGFVEVPLEERHHAFEFKKDDKAIEAAMNRIIECRLWMNKYLFKK
jgi:hypothetical protein